MAAIKKAKPPRLYVAADGPRPEREGEEEIVQSVRNYVLEHIDWNCEVKTLFREKNMGCKYAVSGAITWFFDYEEMGIILEDDCLPSDSFFWFCDELLDKYKDDERIFMISGTNKAGQWENCKDSYFFSLGGIWGWATWRRAWRYYDDTMILWNDLYLRRLLKQFLGPKLYRYMSRNFYFVLNNQMSAWAYQWGFCRFVQSALTITPSYNLVSNVGFGESGTNTLLNPSKVDIDRYELQFPLKHPVAVLLDRDYVHYDYFGSKKFYYRISPYLPIKFKESVKIVWKRLNG